MAALQSFDELFKCHWRELRSEVTPWDAVAEKVRGYDGYTRYWCEHAVLGVYWVAEQFEDDDLEYELTSDIDLEGFQERFPFVVPDAVKVRLAEHVGWQRSAAAVVDTLAKQQMSLFEGG